MCSLFGGPRDLVFFFKCTGEKCLWVHRALEGSGCPSLPWVCRAVSGAMVDNEPGRRGDKRQHVSGLTPGSQRRPSKQLQGGEGVHGGSGPARAMNFEELGGVGDMGGAAPAGRSGDLTERLFAISPVGAATAAASVRGAESAGYADQRDQPDQGVAAETPKTRALSILQQVEGFHRSEDSSAQRRDDETEQSFEACLDRLEDMGGGPADIRDLSAVGVAAMYNVEALYSTGVGDEAMLSAVKDKVAVAFKNIDPETSKPPTMEKLMKMGEDIPLVSFTTIPAASRHQHLGNSFQVTPLYPLMSDLTCCSALYPGSHRIVEADAETGDESYRMETSALLVGTSGAAKTPVANLHTGELESAEGWPAQHRQGGDPKGKPPIHFHSLTFEGYLEKATDHGEKLLLSPEEISDLQAKCVGRPEADDKLKLQPGQMIQIQSGSRGVGRTGATVHRRTANPAALLTTTQYNVAGNYLKEDGTGRTFRTNVVHSPMEKRFGGIGVCR